MIPLLLLGLSIVKASHNGEPHELDPELGSWLTDLALFLICLVLVIVQTRKHRIYNIRLYDPRIYATLPAGVLREIMFTMFFFWTGLCSLLGVPAHLTRSFDKSPNSGLVIAVLITMAGEGLALAPAALILHNHSGFRRISFGISFALFIVHVVFQVFFHANAEYYDTTRIVAGGVGGGGALCLLVSVVVALFLNKRKRGKGRVEHSDNTDNTEETEGDNAPPAAESRNLVTISPAGLGLLLLGAVLSCIGAVFVAIFQVPCSPWEQVCTLGTCIQVREVRCPFPHHFNHIAIMHLFWGVGCVLIFAGNRMLGKAIERADIEEAHNAMSVPADEENWPRNGAEMTAV